MLLLPLLRNLAVDLIGEVTAATLLASIAALYYRQDSTTKEREVCAKHLREHEVILADLQRRINENDASIVRIREQERSENEAHDGERKRLVGEEAQAQQIAAAKHKAVIEKIDSEILMLHGPIHRLNSDHKLLITKIDQQTIQWNQSQASELQAALDAIQRQHVESYMKSVRLEAGTVYGIGPVLAADLQSSGYTSAHNVNWGVSNVSGIGDTKAYAIMAWRSGVEQMAKHRMPTHLDKAQADSIRQRFDSARLQLQQRLVAAKLQLGAQTSTLQKQIAPRLDQLRVEHANAAPAYESRRQAIARHYRTEDAIVNEAKSEATGEANKQCAVVEQDTIKVRKDVLDQTWQVAKAQRELELFSNITFPRYIRMVALNKHRS
jgi:hypothetical protein